MKTSMIGILLLATFCQDLMAKEMSLNEKMEYLDTNVATVRSLIDELGIQKVVRSTQLELSEIKKETKVREIDSSLSINTFFFKGSFGESLSTTEFLTTNPKKVAGFNRKSQQNFARLQADLKDYLKTHTSSILRAKELTVNVLSISRTLPDREFLYYRAELQDLLEKITNVMFFGEQHVDRCTRLNYINYSNKAEASFLGISLGAEDKHFRHSEVSCENSTTSALTSEESIFNGRILTANRLLSMETEEMQLRMLKVEAPAYPTWDLAIFGEK